MGSPLLGHAEVFLLSALPFSAISKETPLGFGETARRYCRLLVLHHLFAGHCRFLIFSFLPYNRATGCTLLFMIASLATVLASVFSTLMTIGLADMCSSQFSMKSLHMHRHNSNRPH
jgi:cellulose synthase/poly-beta-1,6-N-acetylglucosamine synthase-like glycosyltransferase